MIFIMYILTACYKSPERAVYINGFGYQYILPTNDWYESESSDIQLSIYGSEGEIDIQFLMRETSQQSQQVGLTALEKEFDLSEYIFSEVEYDGTNYLFMQLDNPNINNEMDYKYLAVFPFTERIVVIAKGKSNEGFENSFDSIFRKVIFSLKPFTPSHQ